MTQRDKTKPKIFLNEEEFELQNFYISELGYLMMRLCSTDDNTFLTYNLGKHDPNSNMFLNSIQNEKQK
jgi:hypothetical protein